MKCILVLLPILILTSCGNNDLPDVVKFKSGQYGSKTGEFLAKFPGEPKVSSQHFQLGLAAEYDEYFFQYRIANEHIYNVSYADLPTNLLKAWEIEQLFDQIIKNISSQHDTFKVVDRKVNIRKDFEKSITYTLYSSTPGAMMKVELLKYGKRFYYIYFACTRRMPENKKIDAFLNSFKIYKPK